MRMKSLYELLYELKPLKEPERETTRIENEEQLGCSKGPEWPRGTGEVLIGIGTKSICRVEFFICLVS